MREPRLTDAFFQVNLHDGFGFLDVRGALIRHFRDEFQGLGEMVPGNAFPPLLFGEPIDPQHPIIEMRIGVEQIWIHLRSGASSVSIRQECARVVEGACSLMNVTRFSRQGLRTQHVFETDTIDEALNAVRRTGVVTDQGWGELGLIQHAGAQLTLRSGRIKAIVRFAPARSVGDETSDEVSPSRSSVLPPIGVMLDIDAFDDARSDTRDPKPHLNRAMKYIEERALPFVTRLLQERGEQ